MRRLLPVLTLAAILSASASAQMDDDSPLHLPDLKRETVIVKKLEYDFELPQGRVATVDDHVLTQADLLKTLLEANVNQIANVLLDSKIVELELEREGLTVSAEERTEELEELLPRLAPNMSLEEVLSSGVYSRDYLDRMASMTHGWKKLFWKAKNISEEQRASKANQFLMQLYVNEVKNRYQIALRGKNPAPPKGAMAAINTIIKGKRRSYEVSPREALSFLLGLLRPASFVNGQDEMIDRYLVQREMDQAHVVVTPTEVEGWVREMRSKFQGPFNWDMILKVKGTTPDAERVRYHDVLAWKRCNGIEITNEMIDAFRDENDDFFRTRHVKVAHVLVKFVDPLTGLSKGPEAEKKALAKAQKIYEFAIEGVEFERLAELYSDDDTTKGGGGKLGQPIKKWGGGYDKEFQRVAYGLEAGEISKPVRSVYGYHVIKCLEVHPPTEREIDWRDPRYADWILEEFETNKAAAWRDSLRRQAKIEKSTLEELIKIKSLDLKPAK